ncbi:hypothetical protein J6590_009705 [Homalodisca vitripennis]|nr:hypothetical protein J6590_009705 [Homalodisca vitripennis]
MQQKPQPEASRSLHPFVKYMNLKLNEKFTFDRFPSLAHSINKNVVTPFGSGINHCRGNNWLASHPSIDFPRSSASVSAVRPLTRARALACR